jgi:acetyl esterase/lipase
MSDRARLVDILALFFGGVGAGAGLATMIAQRVRASRSPVAAPPPIGAFGALHTPPTVPWHEPGAEARRRTEE